MTFGFQLIAVFGRSAVLPHNSIVNGFTGLLVPYDGGFPLVGNANAGHLVGSDPFPGHHFSHYAELGRPDLFRIMFHPSRMWVVLLEFFLRYSNNITRMIKQDS